MTRLRRQRPRSAREAEVGCSWPMARWFRGGTCLWVFLLWGTLAGPGPAHAFDGPRTEPTVLEVGGTVFTVDAPRGMGRFVREASAVIDGSWERVRDHVGAPAGSAISVHIEADLHDWFRRSGLPARSPEWAAGLAIPSRRTILLAPGNPDWERTMVHELAHLSVALAAGDGRVPRWFDEGNAVLVAEQYGLDRATVLLRAGVLGRYLDFADLEAGFPPGAAAAELAYAQSAALVRHLTDAHGEDVFRDILRRMREGEVPWHQAFLERTGRSSGAAYAAWLEQATARWRWVPIAAGGGMAWTGMAFLFLWVWRRKRKRDAARLRAMQRSEDRYFDIDPDDATFGGRQS